MLLLWALVNFCMTNVGYFFHHSFCLPFHSFFLSSFCFFFPFIECLLYFFSHCKDSGDYTPVACITDESRAEATFSYSVESISKLKDTTLSPPVMVRNLPWWVPHEILGWDVWCWSKVCWLACLKCNDSGVCNKCKRCMLMAAILNSQMFVLILTLLW